MGLQERLPLCAKEHALLALSGTHSSSAQKKLLEFLCNPKMSEAQRISISAAADPWGAAAGTCRATRTSSLQVQRDRLSVYAGFSSSSRSSPVSYLPLVTTSAWKILNVSHWAQPRAFWREISPGMKTGARLGRDVWLLRALFYCYIKGIPFFSSGN